MLVLSRKNGERIFIGDNVVITVVDIERGKVRLGVEAPRDVAIYREEIRPQPSPEPFQIKPLVESEQPVMYNQIIDPKKPPVPLAEQKMTDPGEPTIGSSE